MRFQPVVLFLATLLAVPFDAPAIAQGSNKKAIDAAFSLADVKYFHGYTQADQHEYTPAGQEDLRAWRDMVTVHLAC
jgi:hypothetical protein